MTVKDDIRKTLTDPTPLYFAAGVVDKIREEAPERISAVRTADRADLKKLREQAQSLAMQGLEMANEYATKARVTYDELAERGRGAVRTWRGEGSEEAESSEQAPHVTVEREKTDTQKETPAEPQAKKPEQGDEA